MRENLSLQHLQVLASKCFLVVCFWPSGLCTKIIFIKLFSKLRMLSAEFISLRSWARQFDNFISFEFPVRNLSSSKFSLRFICDRIQVFRLQVVKCNKIEIFVQWAPVSEDSYVLHKHKAELKQVEIHNAEFLLRISVGTMIMYTMKISILT